MSRGTCRANQSISTVDRLDTRGSPRKFCGHCRRPPPKNRITCICGLAWLKLQTLTLVYAGCRAFSCLLSFSILFIDRRPHAYQLASVQVLSIFLFKHGPQVSLPGPIFFADRGIASGSVPCFIVFYLPFNGPTNRPFGPALRACILFGHHNMTCAPCSLFPGLERLCLFLVSLCILVFSTPSLRRKADYDCLTIRTYLTLSSHGWELYLRVGSLEMVRLCLIMRCWGIDGHSFASFK